MRNLANLILCLLLLTNCSSKHHIKLERSNYSKLKHWSTDNHNIALEAFAKSCSQTNKIFGAVLDNNKMLYRNNEEEQTK